MFSQHCAYRAKYPPSVFFPSHRFTKRLKFPSIFNRLREAIPGNDYDSYICITAYIRESRFLPHVSSFPHRLFKTQKNGSHFPTLEVGSHAHSVMEETASALTFEAGVLRCKSFRKLLPPYQNIAKLTLCAKFGVGWCLRAFRK